MPRSSSARASLNKERGPRRSSSATREPGAVDEAFAALRALLGRAALDVPGRVPRRARAAAWLNTWNQYQCMATFNLSRSASLYETGIGRGMGFRDSNQDILGFVHLIPDARPAAHPRHRRDAALRRHLLPPVPAADEEGQRRRSAATSTTTTSGSSSRPARTSRRRATRRSSTRPVGYATQPGQRRDAAPPPRDERSRTRSRNRGPHGLPLIGHADWNDCLNLNCFSTEPNETFQRAGDVEGSQAESVMIAGLFLYACREMAALYRHLGQRRATRAGIDGLYDEMLAVVEDAGVGRRVVPSAPSTPPASRSARKRVRRGQDLHREPGLVRARRRRADGNGRAPQALESVAQAPRSPRRHRAPAAGVSRATTSSSARSSSYPPGVQGERRHLLPQQHVDPPRLVPARRRRPRPRVLPRRSARRRKEDADRDVPQRAVRLRADDRRPRRGLLRRGEELLAHRHRGVDVRRALAGHPRRQARLRRACASTRASRAGGARTACGGDSAATTYDITVENPDGVCAGVRSLMVDGRAVDGNVVPLAGVSGPVRVEVVLG